MKNKAFVFVILFCFVCVSVFSQNQSTVNQVNRVLINMEIIDLIENSNNRLDELIYYLSEPLTIIIDDPNTEPNFEIRNGNIIFTNQYISSMVIQLSVNHAGRLHVYNDNQEGAEIFEVIFFVQNRYVGLLFRRNVHQDSFNLLSAIINGKPYNLNSQGALPRLMIGSNLNLR